jgi:hypothetical protein
VIADPGELARIGRVGIAEAVSLGHRRVQPAFMAGEDVGVSGAADEDELRGEGAGAGQGPQMSEGVFHWHRAQPGGVAITDESRVGEDTQPFDLRLGQARNTAESAQDQRGREGVQRLPGDGDALHGARRCGP